MKKIISSVLRKIKNKFVKTNSKTDNKISSVILGPEADVEQSTYLLFGSGIRFDIGREKRIYVTIKGSGIITSNFIFESLSGKVSIGQNVHIGGATFISRSSIRVDDDVTMAWDITLYDHNSHSIY